MRGWMNADAAAAAAGQQGQKSRLFPLSLSLALATPPASSHANPDRRTAADNERESRHERSLKGAEAAFVITPLRLYRGEKTSRTSLKTQHPTRLFHQFGFNSQPSAVARLRPIRYIFQRLQPKSLLVHRQSFIENSIFRLLRFWARKCHSFEFSRLFTWPKFKIHTCFHNFTHCSSWRFLLVLIILLIPIHND